MKDQFRGSRCQESRFAIAGKSGSVSFYWSNSVTLPSLIYQDRVMKYIIAAFLACSCVFALSDRATVFAQQSVTAGLTLPDSDDGIPGAGPIRRYDWFKNLWTQLRTKWSQETDKHQKSLVFLGDSITQGWGDDFQGKFPGVRAANRGISGDTTRGMLYRLKDDVLALKPAGVVMLMGRNDLEENASPETIADNIKLIIAELKKHDPKMPVILCQVFPSSAEKKRPADNIKQINKLLAQVVKTEPQVTLVDTWALFANEQGDAKLEDMPDLLHLNALGYAKWAAAIWPVLATLDFVETNDDAFALEPGFESLFNGKDLTGWGFRIEKTLEMKESFDGKTQSDDGRYVAKHGRVIVTTPSEGSRVQQLWTTREFPKNFLLKLEFRATPNADSGVFIRKPQLQCRDYPLAGPYKSLKQYKPQDWNEMVVTVKDNVAHCTCNGEVLEAALKLPESGPVGLEGDRGQMEYRRIRIQELP